MILSMTGFGKAVIQLSGKKITVEIKSLNSKSLDLNVRIPSIYREVELKIRNLIAASVVRGKVDFNLYVENTAGDSQTRINEQLVKQYAQQLETIKGDLSIESDTLAIAMRLPDVLQTERGELNPEEWKEVQSVIKSALEQLNDFRKTEGQSLENDLSGRIAAIRDYAAKVIPFESERLDRVKERLTKGLETLGEGADSNRFEQELIFYIEKLDINEEKVRLAQHLEYFENTMNTPAPGKKLGFISQEIGREINTMGSKANHAEIQKFVVGMKDELEKIKEQVLNTL